MPQNPNRSALTTASDVTSNENCYHDKKLKDATHYNMESGLSYEEYYKKLYYICPDFDEMEGYGKRYLMPSLKKGEIGSMKLLPMLLNCGMKMKKWQIL